jgi:Protein of unknwon function (DUF3310)
MEPYDGNYRPGAMPVITNTPRAGETPEQIAARTRRGLPEHPKPPLGAKASETQVGGEHYTSLPIQPMTYSMANNLDACQHTIVKYVTRFREKGGKLDLEKAKHTIDLLIEHEYGVQG